MADPFAGDFVQIIADPAGKQDLTEQDIKRDGGQHKVIQRLIGDDWNLRQRLGAHQYSEPGHTGQPEAECDRQPD